MVQADAVSCGDKGSSDALKVRGWCVCVGRGGAGGGGGVDLSKLTR